MRLDLLTIQMEVEKHFGFRINVKSRRRNIVDARRLYFRLAREFTTHGLYRLGASMDRDHATALFAIRTCKDICAVDKEFNAKYLTLRRKLEIKNSEKYKKNLFVTPRVVHPGRFRYGKTKSISKVFNQRGYITKQRNELH